MVRPLYRRPTRGTGAYFSHRQGLRVEGRHRLQAGETDKRFGLWQYTDNGGVEGFRYPFDFNFAFKDYKAIMMKWGLNGYGMPNPLPESSIV